MGPTFIYMYVLDVLFMIIMFMAAAYGIVIFVWNHILNNALVCIKALFCGLFIDSFKNENGNYNVCYKFKISDDWIIYKDNVDKTDVTVYENELYEQFIFGLLRS